MSSIWIKTSKNRKKLKADITELLDAAGVSDWLGSTEAPVILKPNLVVSRPASGGATTHPEIAAAVIEYLSDLGYSNIIIAEGSWVGDSTANAFKACGYTALASKYGIRLIDLQKDEHITAGIGDDNYRICRTIANLDKNGGSLINLPVLKGHGQTRLTCALKNLKGCIPDTEKRRYHKLGVHRPVAVLNSLIKPAFTLVDGLNGDPGWEEGGSPRKMDLLLAGRDPVSIDSYACGVLGFRPQDVEYIRMAEALGAGSIAGPDDPVYLDYDAACITAAEETETRQLRERIDNIVDQRSACSACFGNLASALRQLSQTDPALLEKPGSKSICIGQDFRGSELPADKTGIGVCTSGPQTLKGCPPSRQAITEFLKKAVPG